MMRRRTYGGKKLKPIYEISNISFTGSNCVDTEVKLWDGRDFILIISFTSLLTGTVYFNTLLHCLKESGNFQGFVIDSQESYNALRFAGPRVVGQFLTGVYNNKKFIALKRSGNTIYLLNSGRSSWLNVTSYLSFTNCDKNLLIGAFQSDSLVKGRYWKGTVHHCAVYVDALSDTQIQNLIDKEFS